jgi:hypothetical protein
MSGLNLEIDHDNDLHILTYTQFIIFPHLSTPYAPLNNVSKFAKHSPNEEAEEDAYVFGAMSWNLILSTGPSDLTSSRVSEPQCFA